MVEAQSKVKDAIEGVPEALDELYLEIFRSMENAPESLRLVQWIRYSRRALSLDELRWAMVVDAKCSCKSLHECESLPGYAKGNADTEKRVKNLSCGLVEIVPSSHNMRVAQFIHQSVKDFVDDTGLSELHAMCGNALPRAISTIGIAHCQIYGACVRYLEMEEIGQKIGQIENTPKEPWYKTFFYAENARPGSR